MERAQRVAAGVVSRVLSGATLAKALAVEADADRGDRPLIHELAYGTLRFLGELRALVLALADRPLVDASVEALLWVALYQLIHTTAPPPTVVDCAVGATSRLRRPSAKGMVNAILRNFLRRRDALLAEVRRDPAARFSYQNWWIERVRAEYAEHFAEILDAGNARPPLCLRVNARRIAPEALVALFATQSIAARRVGPVGIIIDKPRPVIELPGYTDGAFSVQDAAAQLAAPLLGVADGMRVLDACAAPGGKTTHLAELATLDLTAVDVDNDRLARVAENLARLRLSAQLIAGDASQPGTWWDAVPFDRILADVPCTASGVVRRHPDAKWLRRESDVASFAQQQRRLLEALWPLLARGGRLLYSTCSVFHTENAEQVETFVARHPDVSRVRLAAASSATGEWQLLPAAGDAEHNHDGFFYALLEKS